MLAVATVDALGGPAEFRSRFSFPLITSMVPNAHFGLPAGVWTDDTSMTLCLARSLSTYAPPGADSRVGKLGGFDEVHQLDMYSRWWKRGYLSATGSCFDIGGTIQRALFMWSNRNSAFSSESKANQRALDRIKAELDGDYCCGNGSLMRILPIGLAYWRNEEMARKYAYRSSEVTHPNKLCGEACEVWTRLILRIMNEATGEMEKKFTKLDLLTEMAGFPYTQTKLRDILALPSSGSPPPNTGTDVELEEYYRAHHPLLALIPQSSTKSNSPFLTSPIPPTNTVPSTGYVLHTLVAALYAFFTTRTFEEGAIMVVNMGDDADTVGAVYGGLAGCWYGGERGSERELFWTPKVDEWMGGLVKKELVEEVA